MKVAQFNFANPHIDFVEALQLIGHMKHFETKRKRSKTKQDLAEQLLQIRALYKAAQMLSFFDRVQKKRLKAALSQIEKKVTKNKIREKILRKDEVELVKQSSEFAQLDKFFEQIIATLTYQQPHYEFMEAIQTDDLE